MDAALVGQDAGRALLLDLTPILTLVTAVGEGLPDLVESLELRQVQVVLLGSTGLVPVIRGVVTAAGGERRRDREGGRDGGEAERPAKNVSYSSSGYGSDHSVTVKVTDWVVV